ncbi:MAG: hypothetical protein IH587_11105 [Anaerolineae bacterium]|nr:hypothetical protein [Anaerolineae bacterium]
MWMRRICWGLMVMLVAACTATSMSARCSNPDGGNRTVCDLDMDSLSSTWSQNVAARLDESAADVARLRLTVAVETGVVRVSFPDALGERLEYEVTPESPLDIEETAQVADRQTHVAFEAIGGPATGVVARIEVAPEE